MAPPPLVSREASPSSSDVQPLKVEGLAGAVTGITAVLLIISTVVVALRIWVRGWKLRGGRPLGWDDWLIAASFVRTPRRPAEKSGLLTCLFSRIAYVPSSTYVILAAQYGLGTPDSGMTPAHKAKAAGYMGYWEIPYAVSVNLCKASIAVALIRLAAGRRNYLYALWGILISEIIITVVCLVTLFIICEPPGAQWDSSIGTCKSYTLIPILSWPFTVVNILTDWSCAIIPWILLRGLNMDKKRKNLIVVVLALGALASTGSIVRSPYLKYYLIEEDRLYQFGHVVLWSIVENGLGIIAASLPPLYQLFVSGRTSPDSSGQRFDAGGGANATIGGTPLSQSIKLKRLKGGSTIHTTRSTTAPADDRNWDRLTDSSSNELRLDHGNGRDR